MAGWSPLVRVPLLLLHVYLAIRLTESKRSFSDDSLSLLQVASRKKLFTGARPPEGVMCQNLKNFGTYFTLGINVGTPPQKFNVIPDTGSDMVVIPDCKCVRTGQCPMSTACFQKPRSSTFEETDLSEKVRRDNGSLMYRVVKGRDENLYAELTYGSGPVTCSVGSDRIGFGDLEANLTDQLFLVQNRERLKVGEFGGLMGLGVPMNLKDFSMAASADPLFMQRAGVKRYSMCYNAGGEDGYIKWNVPKLAAPLSNVGHLHWGLDLQGVSVGDDAASADSSVLFCGPKDKKEGMQTACGAIPDSGTTHILGPKEQITKLFAAICHNWPRCRKAAEKDPGISKVDMFTKLLMECGKWLGPGERALDDEIPPITFHLGGASGEKQKVELSAWSYIGEATVPRFKEIYKKVMGRDFIISVPVGTTKTCSPSFTPHDYNTKFNGPIWILGTALFYDKTVSYDISTDPPAVSIDDTPCSPCDASLQEVSTSGSGHHGRRKGQKIRSLNGPIREPDIDVTVPF